MNQRVTQIQAEASDPPHAIVIAMDCFTGIQTARLLARRGVPVIGIVTNPKHWCAQTRVCRNILVADTDSTELIEVLRSIGPQLPQKAVLYPCSDMSVLIISRHRHLLERWYHVVLPSQDVVELLMDKVKFNSYAQTAGFLIPATYLLYSRSDAKTAARQLNFPCILKPYLKTPEWNAHTSKKVFMLRDAQEFLSLYEVASAWAEVLMVQDWIQGPDLNLYSCNCYFFGDSKTPVTFIARKIRQWPPETGTSSLGEECRNDLVLQETLRLFKGVNFRGLGYLEMKRDQCSGRYFIIEPNVGRPTGRSAISEAGGVELLYSMYCDSVGWPLPQNREQKYNGVKWIYLRRDLQSAWSYWRRGELNLTQWWRSIRGPKAYALFSWQDPVPFVEDCRDKIKKRFWDPKAKHGKN